MTRRIASLCLCISAAAFAQDVTRVKNHAKYAPDLLANQESGEARPVIVQFHGSIDPRALSSKSARRFSKINPETSTAEASVDAEGLAELASLPEVAYITPDREVGATQSAMISLLDLRPSVKLNFVDPNVSGRGIGVAIIDSGIDADTLLRNDACTATRIVYSQSFVAGETTVTGDPYGHGTHVAGILAGNGRCLSSSRWLDTSTFSGIAPGVNIVNLRVLDKNGKGTDSAVIAAIDRAIALRATHNIRILSLSLGRQIRETFTRDPLCQAVEKAWKAGLVVVVAAGNNGRDNSRQTQGYSTISSPGNDPYVITVGATRAPNTPGTRDGQTIASYSSKGPALLDQVAKPDLVAPGNLILSRMTSTSFLTNTYKFNLFLYLLNGVNVDSLFMLSGTSMATPSVAGTAALMLQRDPSLTPDQVKARLMKTAWKGFTSTASITDQQSGQIFNLQHDLFTIGAGMLDSAAALANNEKIPASSRALSPRVVRVNGKATLTHSYPGVTGVNVVWGTNVVWGENVVWGTNVVWGSDVVWGENVVWGESNTAGSNVVWGTNVVWGESSPFSESLAIKGDN